MAKSPRRNITFELPPAVFQALKEDAEVHGLESHHKRARDIVIDYLTNRDLADLRTHVAALDTDISYLAELVRRVAYSVIVHAAGRDSKEANEWIREHMTSKANR